MAFSQARQHHLVFANHQAAFGGGERVLIEQVAALAEWPVKISVVFERFPDQRDIEPELRARNPHFAELVHLGTTGRCMAWLLRHRPDAAMVCIHRPFLTAARRLARLGFRRPLAGTVHEHYDCVFRPYRTSQHLFAQWILCYDFEPAFRKHLQTGAVDVIEPLYAPLEPVSWGLAERLAARQQLGVPPKAFVIGYIGRQGINKDPWVTLAIAEQLQQHLAQPVHVLFAGQESPEVTTKLDAAVARSALRSRVKRLGRMTDNRPAFHALDLFVLPSWGEGFFPLSLIEAMERGVPVLATSVGGIATVLRDGHGGFLIPKTDDRQPLTAAAIARAHLPLLPHLADDTRWETQRQRAAEVIHQLRANCTAATRYRAFFARLLGQ